jgi:hypothetical protein
MSFCAVVLIEHAPSNLSQGTFIPIEGKHEPTNPTHIHAAWQPSILNLIGLDRNTYFYTHKGKGKSKGKAIPLRAWTGPEGFRKLRLPDFKTIGT